MEWRERVVESLERPFGTAFWMITVMYVVVVVHAFMTQFTKWHVLLIGGQLIVQVLLTEIIKFEYRRYRERVQLLGEL
jgi:hypothetical protein